MLHRSLAIALSLIALTVYAPADAEACSYAAAEWTLLHRGNTIVTPAGQPVVVMLVGYDNPFETLPPLTDATFDIALVDGDDVAQPGTIELLEGAGENTARLVFTPDADLIAGGEYQLTLTRVSDGTPTILPLDVLDSASDPMPLPGELSLTETRQDAGVQCCETPEEDGACLMDDCGGFEFGEECQLCWPTSYEYPVRGDITWQLGSDVPSTYLTHRVFRVDGEDEELVIEWLGIGQASTTWPVDFDGDYCLRIEVTDVIRGLTGSQEVCADAAAIETVERTEPDFAELEDRCVPGTVEPDPDDEPDVDDEDGPNMSSGDKAEPGGCNTSSAPVAPTLLLLFLALIGLRRVARTDD